MTVLCNIFLLSLTENDMSILPKLSHQKMMWEHAEKAKMEKKTSVWISSWNVVCERMPRWRIQLWMWLLEEQREKEAHQTLFVFFAVALPVLSAKDILQGMPAKLQPEHRPEHAFGHCSKTSPSASPQQSVPSVVATGSHALEPKHAPFQVFGTTKHLDIKTPGTTQEVIVTHRLKTSGVYLLQRCSTSKVPQNFRGAQNNAEDHANK